MALLASIAIDAPAAGTLRDELSALKRIDKEQAEPGVKSPFLEAGLIRIIHSVADAGLPSLSNDDALDYYDATRLTAFYAHKKSTAIYMRVSLGELEHRGLAPASAASDMVGTYVAARMFDDAASFLRERPPGKDLIKLPAYSDISIGGASPTILEQSEDGLQLTRKTLAIEHGSIVIVVSSPWCQFSKIAAEQIEADSVLAPIMSGRSVWLLPQQVISDLTGLSRWNRAHPVARMKMIFQQDEWPWLTSQATPGFYFFRDGKLIDSFSGWPGDQRDRLRKGLRSIGINN